MDNHRSHETLEFIKLANENHILPYPLIAHLTHCMQPLDVGIFQLYKHWHDVAIKDVLAGLNVEYSLRSFLRDLTWICEQTFKKSTIRHAFRKSGMFPPDATECLKQLKTFNLLKEKTESLLTLPRTSTKPMEVEMQIDK
jgi:DDE superfamily endonuclease